MLYLGMLLVTLVMMLVVTAVGLRVCDLLPFQLRQVGRAYFSPVLGLAVLILLATLSGWIIPFKPAVCGGVTLVLAGYSLWRERRSSRVVLYFLAVLTFSVVASAPILFPVMRFEAFNPFNDAFTYIEHAQWLQLHPLSQAADGSGHYPAATQVLLYQTHGHRMGASFFLAWVQALFRLDWSYYAYPAAMAVPLTAGSLAVAGAVRFVTRRGKLIPALTAGATATTLNGFVFGSTYGFFPQTFGLALAVGAVALLGASLGLHLRLAPLGGGQVRTSTVLREAGEIVPVSLALGAFAYTYNDLLPFVLLAVGILTAAIAVFHRDRVKPVLGLLAILSVETLLLVNVEALRILNNFLNTMLGVGSGSVRFGWPVLWQPWEFAALTFGLRSSTEGLWLLAFKVPTAIAFAVLLLALLYALVSRLRTAPRSAVLLLNLSVLGAFTAGFIYFRYRLPGSDPGEVGQTFIQFKLAKWASVFAFVVVGVGADFYARRHRMLARVVTVCLSGAIFLGLAANYWSALPLTNDFLEQTGYRRAGFDALLHLRRLAANLPANDVIYMSLGEAHHKLRQMVSYILWDRKLASNYNDDAYIRGHLPMSDRAMPFSDANWVIEFLPPAAAGRVTDARAGNLVVRQRPETLVNLAAATGGYDRESDGKNWWHWTSERLTFRFNVLGSPTKGRFRFLYMPATPNRTLSASVESIGGSSFSVPMQGGWNESVSPVVDIAEPEVAITFATDQPAAKLRADPRSLAFLVGDVRFEFAGPSDAAAPSGQSAAQPMLQAVAGGYDRENDGRTWRYWTAKQLEFQYVVPETMKSMRLKFTYLPAVANRTLKVIVNGQTESALTLTMKPGWNDYVSAPVSVDGSHVTVRFVCDGEPIRLGANDPRLASFLVQNLELLNVERAAPVAHTIR